MKNDSVLLVSQVTEGIWKDIERIINACKTATAEVLIK